MLFRIDFKIPWNSLMGPTILLSISSNSGTTDAFISSIVVAYTSTWAMVCSACGCLDSRPYSLPSGWKMVVKCCANSEAFVKRFVTESVYALLSLSNFSVAFSIDSKRRA